MTRVLLGVTGGIAAYKAPLIVRCLIERGAEVRVAVTEVATRFVAPLALEVTSGRAVYRKEWLEANGSGKELHMEAARWAEVVCVAPATANFLGQAALGLAGDFLATTLLATEAPVIFAPAMHASMWRHPAVQAHVERLERRGACFVGPEVGALANGDVDVGRLAEPAAIAEAVLAARRRPWAGRRVLVTAGPTREAIDPVRFLSNRSTGRMGFALAAAAARRGAEVVLVAGPTSLPSPGGLERRDVASADEMERSVHEVVAQGVDLVIMAAAVADYRPQRVELQKVKKGPGPLTLALERTSDILAGLRARTTATLVGFAAETGEVEARAREKLERKALDFVVANDVSRSDIGFGSEENEVMVIARTGDVVRLPRASKIQVAEAILDLVGEEHDEPSSR